MVICPKPQKWHEIFQVLERAWKKNGAIGSPPPVPLILAGGAYSNDLEKKARWDETMHWAREHKLEHLLFNLTDEDMYAVNKPSSYTVGPMGGPMYLSWDYTSKPMPSEAEIKNALQILVQSWQEIVGTELASATRPLCFTGKKKRRLLLSANPKVTPPWGSWTELGHGDRRRSFTHFRRVINDAIKPLHVDHIDFKVVAGDADAQQLIQPDASTASFSWCFLRRKLNGCARRGLIRALDCSLC